MLEQKEIVSNFSYPFCAGSMGYSYSCLPKIVVYLFILLNLSGCSLYQTDLQPKATTYPLGPNEVSQVVSYGGVEYGGVLSYGGIISGGDEIETKFKGTAALTYDTVKTQVGDTAVIEVYVHDRDGKKNASREFLEKRAREYGGDLCSENFLIGDTTYFYGDEATTMFAGLSGIRSLRVEYRCELKFSAKEHRKYSGVMGLAKDLPWSTYFDVLVLEFDDKPDELYKALQATAKSHGMSRIDSGKKSAHSYYYLGKPDRSESRGHSRIEYIAAIVEPSISGSTIQIVFPCMRYRKKHTSVASRRNIPDEYAGVMPWERDVAYDRARYFLSVLVEAIDQQSENLTDSLN